MEDLNAEKANWITKANIMRNEIYTTITNAASKGKFECWLTSISDSEQAYLAEKGFIVETFTRRTTNSIFKNYKVSWLKPITFT